MEEHEPPVVCPLTNDAPSQPVSTPCGHNFERDALEKHRLSGGPPSKLCPVCHANLPNSGSEVFGLSVNTALRDILARWRDTHVTERPADEGAPAGTIAFNEIRLDASPPLGRGYFGVVVRGMWRGMPVAIKQAPVGSDEAAARAMNTELSALRQLRHPLIVSLQGTAVPPGGKELWAVLELAEHGSLQQLLYKSTPEQRAAAFGAPNALPGATETFFRIGGQVATALAFLHARRVVHGSLKPANVLVCADGTAKLGDFGLAGLAHTTRFPTTSHGATSAPYTAPEVVSGGRQAAPADIFSLGILLIEMLAGEAPFAEMDDAEVGRRVLAGERPAIPPSAPSNVRLLASRCIDARTGDRPTAQAVKLELLAHHNATSPRPRPRSAAQR